MTPATPAAVHERAAAIYAQVAPMLGVHVLCREFALITLGVAAGLGVKAELKHEAGHYFVQFSDGSVSENYFQNIRLSQTVKHLPVWP